MDISLRILKYVVAAAQYGHVTKAAEHLNVSQPSVSSAIADLEARVGFQIFVRHHSRGVTLTTAGERLMKEARLLLKHAHDFGQSARELGGDLKGEISVGCFQTLADRFMPGLLAEFGRRHPGITVSIHEGDHAELVRMVLSGQTELVVAYRYSLPAEIEALVLAQLPPYAVVAATHPLAGRATVKLAELAREPFILLDLPHSRDYFFNLFRLAGLEPRTVFRSKSHELIRGLVAQEQGYTMLNAVPATNVTYGGDEVVLIPLADDFPATEISHLRLRALTPRPAVQAFSVFLHEAFGPGGMFAPERIAAQAGPGG